MIFSTLVTFLLFTSGYGLPADVFPNDVNAQVNNGTIAEHGAYPFMTYVWNCGASLVAPNVLLSAAHCNGRGFGFKTDEGKMAYVGVHDYYNDLPDEDYEVIEIDYKIPHPKYDDYTLDYDYMMVKLKGNSTYNPVVLDDGSSLSLNNRTNVTMMGWGRTGYYDNYCDEGRDDDYYNDLDYCFPHNLLEGQNLFVLRKDCNEFYDEYYKDYEDERPEGGWISERMMCSIDEDAMSGNDVFTGKGDSGGPLIDTKTQIQVGVVSWGGSPYYGAPNVYALVRDQYEWINSYIEDWNFEPKACTDMNNKKPCDLKEGCSWVRGGCQDALTNEECSKWDGKKRRCKKNGCTFRKKTKKCMSRWP